MLSVTERVQNCIQPSKGYLPVSNFRKITFEDENHVDAIASDVASTVGLVVDYMTRFLLGFPKTEAFKISLEGAREANKEKTAKDYLKKIKGLDEKSIINACRLVCFDVAFRQKLFDDNDEKIDINAINADSIICLINRCLSFFNEYGPVKKIGFTFGDGYTRLVSSGDGDYLTNDTLWDLKVSRNRFDSKNTLQILMYYIMGIHSGYPIFEAINRIGLFNPFKNEAIMIDVSDISDEVMWKVSHDVIGYDVKPGYENWEYVNGTDINVFNEYVELIFGGFSIDGFKDGIHEIKLDDYRKYVHKNLKLPYVSKIFLLKKKNYYMFVSLAENGVLSVLNGGQKHRLSKTDLGFYYNNLDNYCENVIYLFSGYWDYLFYISNLIKQFRPYSKKPIRKHANNKLELIKEITNSIYFGKVHGCIVDLDYFNHIFVNPFDGQIVPYNAESKYSRHTYESVEALIAKEIPRLLNSYKKTERIEGIVRPKLLLPSTDTTEKVLRNKRVSNSVIDKNMDMYTISEKLLSLQSIHDKGLVTCWYDNVLDKKLAPAKKERIEKQVESVQTKNAIQKKEKTKNKDGKTDNNYIGKSKVMKNGKRAVIIKFNTKWDITIEFDDGTIVDKKTIWEFNSGNIE